MTASPSAVPVEHLPAAPPTHIAPSDAVVIPLLRPHRRDAAAVPTPRATASSEPDGVPCAARPSTGFRHFDGPCQCFFGGPAPVFPGTFRHAADA